MTKNRPRFRWIVIIVSSSGFLLLTLLTLVAGAPTALAGDIAAQEIPLTPTGLAYELNTDAQGNLWLSDDGAGQIWQINPASGAYTIYSGLTHAADARRDATDNIWWVNAQSTNLGRISLAAKNVTTWTLPGSGNLWGLTLDTTGHIWTTDFAEGKFYRFTASTHEACAYTLPDGGISDYLVAAGANLWLGDQVNDRIVNLDPAANLLTSWQLTADSLPQGLALAANGNLWWADEARHALARLEPANNRQTRYPLPFGKTPEMLTLRAGKLWYTESTSKTIGVLDPTKAVSVTETLVKTTATLTPTCENLGAGISSSLVISTGVFSGSANVYTNVVDSGGWAVYQLPPAALPWGIAIAQSNTWVVDQERHKLLRLLASGTVAGHLFQDTNGNGVQNGGEPGLAGVNVVITDSLNITRLVTSNASGDYSATLPVGNAILDIVNSTLPTGAVQTVGADPTTVVVPESGIVTDVDGFQVRAQLSGRVFEDSDGDGVEDAGEPGLAGVQVRITDSSGAIVTLTTNANGAYSVTVPIGTATVDVVNNTLPVGAMQTVGADPTTLTVTADGAASDTDGYKLSSALNRIYLPSISKN